MDSGKERGILSGVESKLGPIYWNRPQHGEVIFVILGALYPCHTSV